MMGTWSTKRKIIFALSGLALLGFASVLIPGIRILIIEFIENVIVRRPSGDVDRLHIRTQHLAFRGIMLCAIVLFWTFQEQLRRKNKAIDTVIFSITTINYRQFVMPVLVMFGVYLLGISAIIRADFLYIDDLGRSVQGYRGWENWSRYISSFLAIFIHGDTHINDISPLTQLIAAFFIAASSVALVYVINDKKITKTALAVSIPIGLSPYFLECFSYKFDAPYMALSVFASIVPFVFMKDRLAFSVVSVLGLLVMSMTYQASSGIYIIIVILLCFQQWSMRRKTNREILSFMAISIISFCIAMISFRVFFMVPRDTYAGTSVFSLSQIIPGFFHNAVRYLMLVRSDFGIIWQALLLLAGLSFLIKSVIITKRSKFIALLASFAAIALMSVLSFGVYLVLANPLFDPRAMYGFGIFIAMLGIYAAGSVKKAFALPALALCWCFFVFSFSYGNALAGQKRYIEFRTEMLLHDLAILFPKRGVEPQPIKITGSAGHAPVVYNIAARNPVIRRLVPVHLKGNWVWGGRLLVLHYNYHATLFLRFDDTTEEAEFQQIFDSRYHTIKSDGERVLVFLK